MLKKYLLVKNDISQLGFIPRSKHFNRSKIRNYGKMKREQTNYCYIQFTSGDTELSRYDEKIKRWSILCFPTREAM